ncbi:glycosyltransferase family 87 protein [Corynebacterium sp. BF-R-2]|uniref:glycosyltransferase family 87 protein n=1 Tax=Corynebacterium sp. BF-R-2 TaxID=2943494 RepID=UPI00211E566A|nr:glycosyltransferase family 87 protein [Corynebacterium sp. BF-R-2]MCQ9676194.1 DUF2029 domain-containing protein [Corynebacterium sp. BF-R-2]
MTSLAPPSPTTARLWTAAAWPAAVILVLHRVFVLAFTGTVTDDFGTVYRAIRRFWEGIPVYEQDYSSVEPLYLYNPGATLLLSPMGAVSEEYARYAFILANAAAIIAALALLTRYVGRSLRGPVWPVSIAAAFATESVANTLVFTNINGLLLLAMAAFLVLLDRHSWAAGLCIGLAILVKPQFAPLLFLALIHKRWWALGLGITVPVVTNLIAWPLVPGTEGFRAHLLPYLATTRDYANASWPGVRAYFDLPGTLYYPIWLFFALLCAAAILGLLRWRDSEPEFWALSTTGIIMVGIFFLSSLGQQYYSMWLFPMMFTVLLTRSAFHSWGAWLAAILFLGPFEWTSSSMPTAAQWMSVFIATIGWGLLIIVTASSVAGWWTAERSTGPRPRADDKIRA